MNIIREQYYFEKKVRIHSHRRRTTINLVRLQQTNEQVMTLVTRMEVKICSENGRMILPRKVNHRVGTLKLRGRKSVVITLVVHLKV